MANTKKVRILDGIPLLIVVAIIVVLLYVLGGTVFTGNTQRYLLKIMLYITLGTMWNLMSGYTGMTSLGQQGFIGVSGYALCVMTATYGMSYGVGILVGGVIGGLLALGMAVVLLRMRGMYFAIATWVIAEAIKTWFTSWTYVNQGGGMSVVARPYPSIQSIYFMSVTLAIIALLVVYILLKSRIGLGLTAMRDEPDAASSLGVNIKRSKIICFVIAGIFTAVAGAIFYLNKGTIYPNGGFGINWTIAIVFIVIVGGIGTMIGPVVGSIIYVLLEESLASLPGGWTNIVLGAIAILVILFMPKGVMGTLQHVLRFEILSQRRFSKE